ncbi:MAG TPA: hypothetical protein VHO48_13080, partial [Anaerolineaceae bacterium]|nr:hypothetical protein [Anaerolineaceae bacterium]
MNDPEPIRSSWAPPSGYQAVPSKIEGISVFAPAPTPTKTDQPTTYNCPSCGAATHYDVAAGGIACEFCGYQAAIKSETVGVNAQEHEFTLETVSAARAGWSLTAKDVRCESCGAEIIVESTALSTTCPFCGSNRVNARDIPVDLLRPQCLVPFKVTGDAIHARAKEWLGRGWFHPAELREIAGIERFTGIYLPFWTFDAGIDSRWKAEVGYERQERYYDHNDKSWKSRTVIDWRWETGDVSIQIDDLLLTGTSRVSRRILERIYPYDLTALVEYRPDYLAGWQAQSFDVPLTNAWEDA